MPFEKQNRPLTVTETLNFKVIPDWIEQITVTLLTHGYQVFLVGGAVRDLLWGLNPSDWDLATDALPDQVELSFPQPIRRVKLMGRSLLLKAVI